MGRKVKCNDYRCGWHGTEDQILTAPHPFEEGATINGCPECKGVDCVIYACDEPGCWADVTCGTPTQDGYRSTCGKHRPNIDVTGATTTSATKGEEA